MTISNTIWSRTLSAAGSRVRHRLAAVALAVATIVSPLLPAYACSCASPTVEEQLSYADYALAGKVVTVDSVGAFLVADILVETVWKGRVTQRFEIWTRWSSAACGFNDPGHRFVIGKRFILYAYEANEYIPATFTTLCDRNRMYDEAGSDFTKLGRGDRPLYADQVVSGSIDLARLYPNPASTDLTIAFELSQAGIVELSLYNPQGRRVETLYSRRLMVGAHQIEVRLPDLAKGPYFLHVECGAAAQTRPLIVLQ